MSAFVILLHENEPLSNDKLRASIEEKFPGSEHFRFSENAYLVTGVSLTSDVTERIGMEESDELYAAVLRLNGSYTGNSWARFWDWLGAAEKTA